MIDLYAIEAPESARTQIRRRLQQRKCLVCGARDLVNHQTSYFCQAHIDGWRFCSLCETLRTTKAHGKDSRCKGCANRLATAYYHANTDRTIYRIRLRQIAQRRGTRGDQIMAGIRRRIALADLVKATPLWTWERRAAVFGGYPQQLAMNYRRQCAGDTRDVDAVDRARDAHWSKACH